MIKYFCDVCGKEANRLFRVRFGVAYCGDVESRMTPNHEGDFFNTVVCDECLGRIRTGIISLADELNIEEKKEPKKHRWKL